jgi:MFS family permease
MIIAGWLFYAFIYAGFAFAKVEWHAWLLFALYGIYFGMTEGAERALVSDLTPEAVRGTAYGFFHLAVGLGALPASILFGYLWDKFNAETAFMLSAVLACLASVLLAISVRSEREKN